MILSLCVHGPLPDPWLSWALTWTSCMHEDPDLAAPTLLGNDSAVNTNGYPAFPLLFLSDQSCSSCHGKSRFSAATMSQCTNKKLLACVAKLVSLLLCWSMNDVGYNMHAVIRGEHGCAVVSLWLTLCSYPSCGLAIGPRQYVSFHLSQEPPVSFWGIPSNFCHQKLSWFWTWSKQTPMGTWKLIEGFITLNILW